MFFTVIGGFMTVTLLPFILKVFAALKELRERSNVHSTEIAVTSADVKTANEGLKDNSNKIFELAKAMPAPAATVTPTMPTSGTLPSYLIGTIGPSAKPPDPKP